MVVTFAAVAASVGSIVTTAKFIQDCAKGWYEADIAWEDFPVKVKHLEDTHKCWTEQLERHGFTTTLAVIELRQSLDAACKLLEDEKVKLRKRGEQPKSSRKLNKGFSKVSGALFPSSIGLAVDRAIKAYDDLLVLLKTKEEIATVLGKIAQCQPSSLPYREDDRYVPLAVEENVLAVVDNSSGPSVVLLFGEPGQGKSMLARHTALLYEKEIDERGSLVYRTAPKDEKRITKASFDQVVYLDCGPKANTDAKQIDLLQFLGCDPKKCTSVEHQLEMLLKDRKLLIVLDNACEEDFLQRMINVCGAGVKLLVTSQREDLCNDVNIHCYISILMAKVSQDEAWRILDCHVGKSIPRDIKVVERLIEAARGNPLILALISSEIDPGRAQEDTEWQTVWNNFEQILRSSESKKLIYGKRYGMGYYAAMQLSIQSLSPGARDLLTLLHLCEGPFVPEEVIQILYRRTKSRLDALSFSRLRMELESRKLLTVSTTSSRSDILLRSWSLHSLTKRFIENEMGDSKTSMLKSLSGVYREFYLFGSLVSMWMVFRGYTIWKVGIVFTIGILICKFTSCKAMFENGYRKYLSTAVPILSFFIKLKVSSTLLPGDWFHLGSYSLFGYIAMVDLAAVVLVFLITTKQSARDFLAKYFCELGWPAVYAFIAVFFSKYSRAKTWSCGWRWETEIETVVSAMYLDGRYDNMRSAWEAIARQRGRLNSTIVRAIEPVTRLLGQPESDRWPRSAKECAARVFLSYICLDRWDVDGINHLMALPVSTLPMLEALEKMLMLATDCDTLQDLLDDKADLCLKGVVEFTRMFVSDTGGKIGHWPLLKEPFKLFCNSNNNAVQDLTGNILVRLDEICRCTGHSLLERLGAECNGDLRTLASDIDQTIVETDGDPRLKTLMPVKDVLQHLQRENEGRCDLHVKGVESKIDFIFEHVVFGPSVPFFNRLSALESAAMCDHIMRI